MRGNQARAHQGARSFAANDPVETEVRRFETRLLQRRRSSHELTASASLRS
jgi:hypothetical protein